MAWFWPRKKKAEDPMPVEPIGSPKDKQPEPIPKPDPDPTPDHEAAADETTDQLEVVAETDVRIVGEPVGKPDGETKGSDANLRFAFDPCADLRAAEAECAAEADALIRANERLRRELAEEREHGDCEGDCGKHAECIAEAAASFRALTAKMRAARLG